MYNEMYVSCRKYRIGLDGSNRFLYISKVASNEIRIILVCQSEGNITDISHAVQTCFIYYLFLWEKREFSTKDFYTGKRRKLL